MPPPACSNVTFTTGRAVTLSATYIVVQGPLAVLWAGTPAQPHTSPVTISLSGGRDTRALALTNELVLGAKVGCCPGGGGCPDPLLRRAPLRALPSHPGTAVQHTSPAPAAPLQTLAVINGANLSLHAPTPEARWAKLGAVAAAGDTTITLAGTGLGWSVGAKVRGPGCCESLTCRVLGSCMPRGQRLDPPPPPPHPSHPSATHPRHAIDS